MALPEVGLRAVMEIQDFLKGAAGIDKALKRVDTGFKKAGKGTSTLVGNLNKAGASFRSFQASFTGQLILGATRAMADFGREVVKVGSEFQKEMSNVQALTGATEKEFEALNKTAKTLGATTAFTAKEAAEGMSFLAQAGFETNEIIQAMPGTLDLAAASNTTLGQSADIVSNILQGFGEDAKETGTFVDILTRTFTTSNTNLQQLGQAMKFVAPVAKSLGLSVQDTAAAMGILGNAGIQASMAGTSLRTILLRLTAPTGAVKETMAELGIEISDAEGNMLPFAQVIGNVNQALEGLTPIQRQAAVATLAGKRAVSAFNILLDEGEGSLAAYTKSLGEGTTAAEIAAAQLDNLAGDTTLLNSALSGLKIEVFELLESSLRSSAQALTGFVTKMSEGVAAWNKVFNEFIPALREWQDEQARIAIENQGTTQTLAMQRAGIEAVKVTYSATGQTLAMYRAGIGDVTKTTKESDEATAALTATTTEWMGRAGQASQITGELGQAQKETAESVDLLAIETSRWTGIAESGVQVLDELAGGHIKTAAEAVSYAEAQKLAAEAEKERLETARGLASGLADFFVSQVEGQQDAIESEQEFNASIAEINRSAGEKATEKRKALAEKLQGIEEQRQEKLHFVLTGAHARTQAENDEALGFWNAHFDELVATTETKSNEQVDKIEAAQGRRLASANAAREKEKAAQAIHLEELKLNAVLAILETTGQLEQFTMGMATTAGDAAQLIKAGVLPVTSEMAAFIQTTLGDLTASSDQAAATATANADLISQALAGTLTTEVTPAIQAASDQFALMGGETIPELAEQFQGNLQPTLASMTGETIPELEAQFTTTAGSMLENLLGTQFETKNQDMAFQNITTVTLPELDTTMTQTMQNAVENITNVQPPTSELVALIVSIGTEAVNSAKLVKKAMKEIKDSMEDVVDTIKQDLIPSIKKATEAWLKMAEAARKAQSAGEGAAGVSPGQGGNGAGGPGGQRGLNFIVPPGFPGDTFPLRASSAERVVVIPPPLAKFPVVSVQPVASLPAAIPGPIGGGAPSIAINIPSVTITNDMDVAMLMSLITRTVSEEISG